MDFMLDKKAMEIRVLVRKKTKTLSFRRYENDIAFRFYRLCEALEDEYC